MLTLNKPYINKKSQVYPVENFVREKFNSSNFAITFSTRQALDNIYKDIYKNSGSKQVAVSPLTCVEALFPIINNGHTIKFIDINPYTLNMDETLIPENIDIVQAIHFGGNPQDMNIIKSKNPKLIIEDCAQALGSEFDGMPIGTFGNYSVFSFMKNIYAYGGGLLLSKDVFNFENDADSKEFGIFSTKYRVLKRYLESKCKIEKNIAFLLLSLFMKLKPDNTTPFVTKSLNNKIIYSSIEKQLSIYQVLYQKRQTNALNLLNKITNKKLVKQKIVESAKSNYHRIYYVLDNITTKEAVKYLRNRGIGANHLSQNFLHPYQDRLDNNKFFKDFVKEKELKNYYELHDRIICIPVSPSLTIKELSKISEVVNSI
ncbi:MAG: DegT/DnrJ/EryC1/StrS family aminotransferase [Bacteroidales bacterium]|nr:DegT/DnrJ/EryC1/StrS family aminotransferase [Bacteroidales bacterium]